MQKMGDTIITDLGMDLLSSVNNGDDKITYTKTVLAADDLTQESDVDIQKTTSLTLIQQTTGTTVISRVDDTVNLGATFTNKEVTQDFDFYVIGWYAKGSAVITDERLFAITPSTVKQTMPAGKDGAATAAISPKYASALSRSATVSLNPDQAGTVTPEYVDQKIQQIISEGIVNAGSTLSESDNLDSFITTGYHLIKGSLPLSAPEGFSNNGQIIVYGNKDTTDGVTQLAYDDINGTSYVRSYNPTNNKWSDWDLVITKSQLNAVLPTDIARTGEDNDFKGKNTFETDPVNKNGDSYGLAKDIATKVTDNGDNSIEINKQAVTPVRDNKNGSINFNSKDMTPADDSAVVHTTGDETIDGQKKFKTDPTDSAGNAYAKTVDVNQQLDKKVNVADMRKPASDVAGIEEVNAKQDKIGYTPADDSKVVHDNHDGTLNINGHSFTPSMLDSAAGENSQPINTDVDTLAKPGLYYVSGSAPNNPFKTLMMLETKIQYDWSQFRGVQISYEIFGTSGIAVRAVNPNGSLTTVGSASPWVFLSDDSKVAHLSGANNFDTVPTVDNNPLLLASSLPSDLARTGSDQEFTGKNTFDTAPIDKTTGHPYITKDGVPAVPSTLADTTKDANFTGKLQKSGIDVATTTDVSSAVNTATANMANTTKLANFTAGLQVNGKDVGTGGGDKLTTPWVVTNYQSTDTMGPHGCNEATGWRIYNDILYYYGYFYGATVSEAVIFNLYTAYPDFKKTFKTLGSSPELMHQTSSGFWAFNDWGNQMVGNEGNLLIGIKDTATPLSV
ncbi:MAG: pyocin knob domain-containing protein, partial [Lactiplantibacillus plantarum]|nr:pyocin knob domain-containing protein [Lactiplantibacillus plantarum]